MVLGDSCPALQPAWQAGSGRGAPTAVLPTPFGCLAPLSRGGALLLDGQGAACEVEAAGAPAAACSAAGTALLAQDGRALLLAALAPSGPPALRTIDLEAEGPLTCIAEAGGSFAIAAGRWGGPSAAGFLVARCQVLQHGGGSSAQWRRKASCFGGQATAAPARLPPTAPSRRGCGRRAAVHPIPPPHTLCTPCAGMF